MGGAYSQDLRDRVIAARDRGIKTKPVAVLFGVSPSWVRRVMQRRRENNETNPRPRGGATVIKIDLDRLRQLVQEQPDATLNELHQRLGGCSVSGVGAALKRLKLSLKKRRSMLWSGIGPMSPSGVSSGKTINLDATPDA
jgi:transposase